MDQGESYWWHIEFDYMKSQVRWCLENIDDLGKRHDVCNKLEDVHSRLSEFCELTKEE